VREVARLRDAAERAKRELNTESSATMELRRADGTVARTIERSAYEARIEPLLARIRRPVERGMRDAGMRLDDLNEVVMVGGSTRKTVVQRLAAQSFGRLPLRHINPDEVVALGAAVQAGLKMRDAALSEMVMTDVCPYTLGVEISREDANGRMHDGIFSPIIERNTVIPASRCEIYYPFQEGQRQIELKVYQGESRRTKENLFLGKLTVRLPKVSRDDAGVEVRFTYDVNGLLEVDATVLHTGKNHRLVIEQRAGSMSKKEVALRLAALEKLKIHPRDQLENQALLNRAHRLFEESLQERRMQLSWGIDQFSAALESQDPRTVEKAREKFGALLDALEFEPLLPQ
jgi:molecular chaperone HscC